MIEKMKGVIRVDKLRALLLMEADFNSLNKLIFSSRMIRLSEQHKRMPEELFGSRKKLSAILVAVNRRLVTDTFRQKRRSGLYPELMPHNTTTVLCIHPYYVW